MHFSIKLEPKARYKFNNRYSTRKRQLKKSLLPPKNSFTKYLRIKLPLVILIIISPHLIFAAKNKTPFSDERFPQSTAHSVIQLDGKWAFQTDPHNIGEKERWFEDAVPFNEEITVPGAWDAQGIGDETDKVKNNYVGKAWYRKEVIIPDNWTGKQIILYIGGVHRYADVWINGKYMLRHVGYLSDFEIDLTKQAVPGRKITVAIRVDSRQDWKIDALTGAFDIIDYMDINWGGIYQHVRLEARNSLWIKDVFIKPDVSRSAIDLDISFNTHTSGNTKLTAGIIDPQGKIVKNISKTVIISPEETTLTWTIPIENPQLWSPNHPLLYRIELSLYNNGKKTDNFITRFGMRQIEIRGADIYLNGKKIYLHGYGDDTNYPKTLSPPASYEEYRHRMKLIKSFGFNYVRHHSSVPLPEYFDTADELGILVQPELPIAYERFLIKGMENKASKQLYIDSWKAIIRRYRNHPSVFGWCMSNEMYGGFELADELYKIAKELDPTRPVYDTDGVPPGLERATLDVLPVQFDVHVLPVKSRTVNKVPRRSPMHPLLKPVTKRSDKYSMNPAPSKPVISHEMGNYVTYPNINDISYFKDNVKPFWLKQARNELAKRNMLSEAKQMAQCSAKLQALSHKINIEAQRMSPYTDGHALWLFQDYWTTNVGLVNTYYKIKGAGPEYYKKFIADVVLLADFPAHTFTSGETVKIPIFISDYGEQDISNSRLSWSLRFKNSATDNGSLKLLRPKEKGLTAAGIVPLKMPDVQQGKKFNFRLTLESKGVITENDWNIWVFPKQDNLDLPDTTHIAQQGLDYLSEIFPQLLNIKQDTKLSSKIDLLITPTISKSVLDYLIHGGRVILTSAWPLFETEISTFEPAWWKGEPVRDASAGTVIYDTPALQEFPHEDWCDLQFLELTDNRYVMLLDSIAKFKQPVIRAIDTYTTSRQKAYLTEWRVGAGALLVSSLNFEQETMQLPEARWLLRSLIRYAAGSKFKPKSELPFKFIAKRMSHNKKRPTINTARFKYYFYEGFWSVLPEFSDITPADSGFIEKIALDNIRFTAKDNYALLIQGYLKIEQEGRYHFYVGSNDGSMLVIDQLKVVDNNGSHGLLEKSGSINLKPGLHFLEVRYFQRGGGQALKVTYEGPAVKRQEIKPSVMIKNKGR
jgi:hypothetical protein